MTDPRTPEAPGDAAPAAAPRDGTVNRFRQRRGRLLAAQIDALADALGRDLRILDLGGRARYWANVPTGRIAEVLVLNTSADEFDPLEGDARFRLVVGDARDLGGFADGSIDLVHSNSVIEHVGLWRDMEAMARESRRVGLSGWIQTPAWEFPFEPHLRLPFLHWFGQPIRRRCIALMPPYSRMSLGDRRYFVDLSNLLSRPEMAALFPGCTLHVERLLFPKSYVARWMPEGMALPG